MQSSAQEAIDEFALDQVIKDAPSERLSLHAAFVTHRIVRDYNWQTEKFPNRERKWRVPHSMRPQCCC